MCGCVYTKGMENKKKTNDEWFASAADNLKTRPWTVTHLSKDMVRRCRLGCYVCDKKNEQLYEVVCDGGEPFWFGTSCAKRLKKETGIDLNKKVKENEKEIDC